jgi:hypothetical protein
VIERLYLTKIFEGQPESIQKLVILGVPRFGQFQPCGEGINSAAVIFLQFFRAGKIVIRGDE